MPITPCRQARPSAMLIVSLRYRPSQRTMSIARQLPPSLASVMAIAVPALKTIMQVER